jgi:hypothetical protein
LLINSFYDDGAHPLGEFLDIFVNALHHFKYVFAAVSLILFLIYFAKQAVQQFLLKLFESIA